MDEPIRYRCLNCGVCCGRLLIERQGVTKGLPLQPSEVNLFLRKDVKPAMGLGEPGTPGFRVFAYQMTRAVCPHHQRGGCVIWAYRPAICRSYPYVPVIDQGLRAVKTFDLTCSALQRYKEKYEGKSIPVDAASVFTESEAYEVVSKMTQTLVDNLEYAWFYDLKTMRWVPFKSMVG